jgi:predicted nucleic acid-binding protein
MGPGLTLDAGALIAWERRAREITALIKGAWKKGDLITVPAAVLAQVWRGNSPRVAMLLAGCEEEDLDGVRARAIGELLAKTRTSDIVDAAVTIGAAARGDAVVTSDAEDIKRLATALGPKLVVVAV